MWSIGKIVTGIFLHHTQSQSEIQNVLHKKSNRIPFCVIQAYLDEDNDKDKGDKFGDMLNQTNDDFVITEIPIDNIGDGYSTQAYGQDDFDDGQRW